MTLEHDQLSPAGEETIYDVWITAVYYLERLNAFRVCVCVGKIVNLAMKVTKDMPIMRSAFPKGSGVQAYCCLSNW